MVGAQPRGSMSASMMEQSLEECAKWAGKSDSKPETDGLHVSMEF